MKSCSVRIIEVSSIQWAFIKVQVLTAQVPSIKPAKRHRYNKNKIIIIIIIIILHALTNMGVPASNFGPDIGLLSGFRSPF
jgi:hypothetical protein